MSYLTFTPCFPGSEIEMARLGRIEIGRTCLRGGKASWIFGLPGETGHSVIVWAKAASIEDARAEIRRRAGLWLRNAGITPVLACAIDAMSRTAEEAMTEDEWDEIIAEGRNLLELSA